MKTIKFALPLAFLMLFASCATLKVSTDYDHSADFKKYKTFSFYKNEKTDNKSTVSTLNRDRVYDAVRAELTKKGYKEVTNNPDFFVNVNALIKDEKSYTANTNIYSYGGMYRPYMWGGMGTATATTTFDATDYKNGSLIIDLIDAKTSKMYWEGIGNKDLDNSDLKNADQEIKDAIAKILASLPAAGM